ncbi:hypothetical protein NPIL_140291 [Nephila pilipes]|uniref:Uncharacterized protein n=1 Tax=Nephila pilipes TaxID=299642 RepID=A0A8X6P0M8_NEPPI|nr:hypothetical protein NPIL_140291 [Nephila pilipes]
MSGRIPIDGGLRRLVSHWLLQTVWKRQDFVVILMFLVGALMCVAFLIVIKRQWDVALLAVPEGCYCVGGKVG